MMARRFEGHGVAASRRRTTSAAALLAPWLAACGAGGAGGEPIGGAPITALERPDTPGNDLQFRFDPDDTVETFASEGGSFLVHFARAGLHAVPSDDADATGIPDFVEEVAAVYDDVLVHYRDELGFRPPRSDKDLPDNGGDERFDVYLVDFAGVGDGHFQVDACAPDNESLCAGFMTQENDYAGYNYPSTLVANRILGSHELFHAVQAAYDGGQGSVLAEGTAVWATESFDPTLEDFEGFIRGYLANADRPLDVPLPGPVDAFSYGSALFFQFLEERYGDGTVRSLLERVEDGAEGVADPVWFEQLDPLLSARAQTTFADAFVEFATWNLFTGRYADPERSYAAGDGYPLLPAEAVVAPHEERLRLYHASATYFSVAPSGRASMTAALVAPPDQPEQLDGLALLLAVRRGSRIGEVVRVADVAAGTERIETDGADRLLVIAVNTLQQGDSRRPTLCIGAEDEVAACRAAQGEPASGGAGAGGGDAGAGGGSSGAGEGSGAASPGDGDGCGCRIARPSAAMGSYALGALLLGLSLRRRRRASARRSPPATA